MNIIRNPWGLDSVARKRAKQCSGESCSPRYRKSLKKSAHKISPFYALGESSSCRTILSTTMLIRVRKSFNIAIKHALSLQEQYVGEPLQRDSPCLFCVNSDMSPSLQQAVNAWPFFHPLLSFPWFVDPLRLNSTSSRSRRWLIDSIHTILIEDSHRLLPLLPLSIQLRPNLVQRIIVAPFFTQTSLSLTRRQ